MAGFLRQATASQSIALGPFIDNTDFKTPSTGLTIANTDVKLVVNGGSSSNKNSGGGTHRVNGVYGLTFDATDTATVGEMEVSCVVTGALPVFDKWTIVEEAVYDALYAASAPGYVDGATVNATKIGGGTVASGSVPNAVAGAAGGLLIAGTNAPVTITGSGDALTLTSTGGNGRGLAVTGDGTGHGAGFTGGNTGHGIRTEAGAGSTNASGLIAVGRGSGNGVTAVGFGTGAGVLAEGGSHGMTLSSTGSNGHGLLSTGGTGGTSDGIKAVAGTGGVDIRGNLTGNVTGNLSGSVNSVTTGVTLAVAAVQAIWDALTSALTTAGSIGKLIVDNLNATITSRMATYTQPTGFLAATFPSGTVANTTNITAGTITTVSGNVNGNLGGTLTSTERNAIADALLKRDMGAVSGVALNTRTPLQALRFSRNKFTIIAGTLTVYEEDDTTVAWTSAITQTPGDPVSASDPA